MIARRFLLGSLALLAASVCDDPEPPPEVKVKIRVVGEGSVTANGGIAGRTVCS